MSTEFLFAFGRTRFWCHQDLVGILRHLVRLDSTFTLSASGMSTVASTAVGPSLRAFLLVSNYFNFCFFVNPGWTELLFQVADELEGFLFEYTSEEAPSPAGFITKLQLPCRTSAFHFSVRATVRAPAI